MAAQISHIIAGEEALASADPGLAALYKREGRGSRDAAPWFRLGCQGPDIFYHNQRTKPSGLHYGALAHRKNFGLTVQGALASILETEASLDSPAVAWILGFATHAALDRATHPFIVCFSGWADPALKGSERYRSCHPFLERLLDLGLLAQLRGISGADFGLASSLPSEERLDIEIPRLVGILAAGLRFAYPRSAGTDTLLERRIANAFSDSMSFFAATDPARTRGAGPEYFGRLEAGASPRSVSLIYPESLPENLDFMNKRRESWPHPSGDGRVYDSGYLELYAQAVETAAFAIGLVLDCLRGGALPIGIAAAIGNGGLSVTDPAGIPLPPRISKPLPLSAIMEAEFARRKLLISSPH